MLFQLPSRQSIYQRVEWIKEKAFWFLIVVLASATAFFIALWLTLLILALIQPQPYAASIPPEFQAKKNTGYKLFAVFQNLPLKADLCSQEQYVYAGASMSQDQFCSFKYQDLPQLNGPFDISMMGLTPLEVRYASVCILRLPRHIPRQVGNGSDEEASRAAANYRYVCQKYRVYNNMRIANSIDPNAMVFLEIQLELTQKGYEVFEGSDLQINFIERANSAWRFVVDYYWLLGAIACVLSGVWTSFVTFSIGVAIMLKLIISEKQAEEERWLKELRQKKND